MYLYWMFFIQIGYLKNIYIIFLPWYWGAICVDLTVYHDLNVCYYGRPMLDKRNLIRIKVANIFTYVTDIDNELKFTFAS